MMGEDSHLAAELGRAAIKGLTNDNQLNSSLGVAPLMKHYVAYSAPEGGHNCAPAHVGRRELLTTFLPPFAAGMDAGAQAVMVSYNEIDGAPNANSHYLLTDITRNRAGGNGPESPWDGFVSSDFGAISNLVDNHKVAHNSSEAIWQYINAGGSVQGFDFGHQEWHDGIVSGVLFGRIKMSALDAAVGRVLRVKARLGLLGGGRSALVEDVSRYHTLISSDAHVAVAHEAARKAMVLLQNEKDTATGEVVLPLDASKLSTLAVIGPNADQPQCGDYAAGGSWGGDKCGGGPNNNNHTSSILGGIKSVAPQLKLTYRPGAPLADYNPNASYFTTIQKHSFTTEDGLVGIIGQYWDNQDRSGAPTLTRNDYLLSFHFLNYGPGQSEKNPAASLPQSAFSARWEGWLTPDCSVEGALFSIAGRGPTGINVSLWIDNTAVLQQVSGKTTLSKAVSLTQGRKMRVRFEYNQPDSTGQHPAVALQWSLQGAQPLQAAIDAVNVNDATVVVVGGGTSETSGEGIDRASLGLPGTQLAFLQAVRAAAIAAKKPLATVVVQGKAFSEPWMKQSLPAILEAWQSGQAQGLAVAETLFGRNNPAGRTAVSFAASADVLPVFYNHKKTAKRGGYQNPPVIEGGGYAPSSDSGSSVLWAFGHGLSFGASFVYSDLTLSASTVPMSGKLEVSFTVTNNGTMSAEEVVQLYVHDQLATVTTVTKQLRNFQRLAPIAAGESVRASLDLDVARDLWLINGEYEKVVEAGMFTLFVGGASDRLQLNSSLEVLAA